MTLYITCYCGLARILPDNVKEEDGESIKLPPCPKCGAPIEGFYSNGRIVLITLEAENAS